LVQLVQSNILLNEDDKINEQIGKSIMITKEQFMKVLRLYDENNEVVDVLNQYIDIVEFPITEFGWQLFDMIWNISFTEYGAEIISYYVFENGRSLKDIETQEEIPLTNYDELWNYVKQYRK
jgi:hypothetical protein